MAKKKREEPASEGAPEWMTTYSDLVTLLLCFFVLLFSMAVVDKQKFVEVANSLRSSFMEVGGGGDKFDSNKGNVIISILEEQKVDKTKSVNDSDTELIKQMAEAQKLEKVIKEVEESIKELKLDNYIKVVEENRNIVLRMDSMVLFDSGSAEILASGKEALEKIGLLLKQLDNDIAIQGHTDNVPINTLLFPTNWELSTKRAVNVVLFLTATTGINPAQLTASGNGEFKPIAPNDSEANRQKNRRIDIMIIRRNQ